MALKSTKADPQINSYNLRIFLLLAGVTVAFAFIDLRLFHLQVLQGSFYRALAEKQHGTEAEILPRRGEIFLTSRTTGQPVLVATTINKDTVFAVPKEIKDKKDTAERLAPLLEISASDLLPKLSLDSSYVPLKKELSSDISGKIKKMKLAGIYLEGQDTRFYPEKTLASQVIGFLGYKGSQRVGQYGVEGKYDEALAGQKGNIGTEEDQSGKWLSLGSREIVPAKNGDDIYLTIDPAIQFEAEEVLRREVAKHEAESGSVIVVDPKSGEVLAMANLPDFDPNAYGKTQDLSAFSNRTLSGDYEPGSIFKPITMAAAINEGKVQADTTYTDEGVVQVDDKQIKNSDLKAHGEQTMTQVLELSLNTGAVFAQQQVGNEVFKNYLKKFGFGQTVDFDLSGQVAGNLDNLNKKGNIFFATASFGQGITVTPLQLVTAYTAIANGGKMITPHVVEKIIHPDGKEEKAKQPKESQVIDPKTAATLSAMMVNVVENGHGKRAAVNGFYIAGKTGTAQVPFKDKTGYDPSRNIGSFIGFGPVDDPKFLMLVRIDSPKDVKFAESTAAPAFGEIAGFILNYLQVKPSR